MNLIKNLISIILLPIQIIAGVLLFVLQHIILVFGSIIWLLYKLLTEEKR